MRISDNIHSTIPRIWRRRDSFRSLSMWKTLKHLYFLSCEIPMGFMTGGEVKIKGWWW